MNERGQSKSSQSLSRAGRPGRVSGAAVVPERDGSEKAVKPSDRVEGFRRKSVTNYWLDRTRRPVDRGADKGRENGQVGRYLAR